MNNIKSIKEASQLVCMSLKNRLGYPNEVRPINEGRYIYVRYREEHILILYKREHFLTFNRHDEGGHGDTINTKELDFALENNVKRIFVVYPNRSIYVISPYTIKVLGVRRINEAESKDVMSFDMKHLIRFTMYPEAKEMIQ